MKHMTQVGIRALKQNASAVLADAAGGEVITITDRGRPVAQLSPWPARPLRRLLMSGRAREPKRDIRALPAPAPGPSLTGELAAMRAAERF
ncbi:MAG: type II toxin-antitoxin system prevent-host-death family antitoxin [Propionibacteriaceae bacterium]|jgi:prevent-host-death family protein|nr:type II toxin-antitoxin system prevent-host-death family antitoxin [Propionibacteriaceae bacterium]